MTERPETEVAPLDEENSFAKSPFAETNFDESEVTAIFPEEDDVLAGEAELDVTEIAPMDPADSSEVFVLLPDAEEGDIPMVDTEEVGATEDITSPFESAFEASMATALHGGLRSANPADELDMMGEETRAMVFDDPTEECFVAEEAMDPVGAEDLDGLARDVADALLIQEGADGSEGEFADIFELEENFVEERPARLTRRRAKRRSPFRKVLIGWAALAALAAVGWYFFPEHRGQVLSYVPAEWLKAVRLDEEPPEIVTPWPGEMSGGNIDVQSEPNSGVGVGVVEQTSGEDALALEARESFRVAFRRAIDLGFSGEVRR